MNQFDHQPFSQRRQRLFDALPAHSLALISSGSELIRNRDTTHPFRAHSDFHYLTGFEEPDSLLVLRKTASECQSILCLREKDPVREIWDGLRLGVDAAVEHLGVDMAFPIGAVNEKLPEWLSDIEQVLFSFESQEHWAEQVFPVIARLKRRVRQGVSAPTGLQDLDPWLHEQRLIKDAHAQAGLKQAGRITVEGHLAAMAACQPGMHEYQLQAALEACHRHAGAQRQAFESIVAAGRNACILHYRENRSPLQTGDLVLIDAGAEVDGYAGDCTHTFPVSGRFSREQAALYDLVLAAQQAAMACVRPGVAYDLPHTTAVRVLTQGLVDLGLLQGDLDTLIEQGEYQRYYMHQTGHWLGNDVHDVGQYKCQGQWRALQVGMALTIEPGLYIASDDHRVEPRWRGIGIRIEDSLLVTNDGHDCLTTGLPRTRREIEAWMASR